MMEGNFTIISFPQMSGRLWDLRACLGLRVLPPLLPETLSEQEPPAHETPTPASLMVPPGKATEPSGMTHKRALKSTSLALPMVDEARGLGRGGPGPPEFCRPGWKAPSGLPL